MVEVKKDPEPVIVIETPKEAEPIRVIETTIAAEPAKPVEKHQVKVPEKVVVDWNKPYESMTVEELQEAILEKMRKNGPVTDYMLRTVRENTHQGSLVNWVKSFR